MTENDQNSNVYSFKDAYDSNDVYQKLCQELLKGLEYSGSGENILENLYYGNLQVSDDNFYGSYRENLNKLCEFNQQFEATLTQDQKELYHQASNQNDFFISLCECQTFIKAFRLGARIMQAIDQGSITQKRLRQDELQEITSFLKHMRGGSVFYDKTSTQEAREQLLALQNQLIKQLPQPLKDDMITLMQMYQIYIKRVKSDAFMDGLEYIASEKEQTPDPDIDPEPVA